MPTPPLIRPASQEDLPAVLTLLERADLPREGVAEHLHNYLVAEEQGRVVGTIGLELYGDTGLLRSAAVESERRGKGIGGLLYDALILRARSQGVHRLVLLTTTAAGYFSRKGFVPVSRRLVTGPVTESVEFSGLCPSHSTCMALTLL